MSQNRPESFGKAIYGDKWMVSILNTNTICWFIHSILL